MLTETERTTALDAAAGAALAEIDAATDDDREREALWVSMAGGAFCAVMSDADADVAASVAQRFNDRMDRDGSGWRLVLNGV